MAKFRNLIDKGIELVPLLLVTYDGVLYLTEVRVNRFLLGGLTLSLSSMTLDYSQEKIYLK